MKNKDELVEINKKNMISVEQAQLIGEVLGSGFSALGQFIDRRSKKKAENDYRKYEQKAKVCITALQEEAKVEMKRLDTAKEYYSSFREIQGEGQKERQKIIDGYYDHIDYYYNELERLGNLINDTDDDEKLKFYMDKYSKVQNLLESQLTTQNKNLNESVIHLAQETNNIINEGRKDAFLSKLVEIFSRK